MKLLIAEDAFTSRTMLEGMCRKWDYQPVPAEDGEAAWQLLQQPDPPRLLLLDWMMPQLDGLALCRRIRRQDSGDDPAYIILLTSRDESADITAGLDAGADDYVTKPFVNAELRARLRVGRRVLELQSELQQLRAR